MSRRWTDPQLQAIRSRKGNFIVSASAGSGKTAVLTERVYQIIEEGTSIDRLLVLTFGNAAAQEMKDRIRKKLIENGKLEEASKLDLAAIQTFDSFAYSIVKKYYYLVGLNKDIKIIDQSVLDLEKRKILQQNLDILVKNPPKIFSNLIYKFCLRDYKPIFDYVYNISKSIDSYPDRKAVYNQIRNVYLKDDYYQRIILSMFDEVKQILSETISLVHTLEFGDDYDPNKPFYGDKAAAVLDDLYSNCSDYDSFANYVLSLEPKLPRIDKTAEPRATLEKIRDNFNYVKTVATTYGSSKEILEKVHATREECLFLLDLAESLDSDLDKFKRKHNSFDFIDISRYAFNILDDKEVLEEFRERFQYIMVDEYQDTSDMQDAVIKKLTNENLFLVGDVKQSIYRFRQANPDIFLRRFNDYGEKKGGERIDLIHNFRSREEIIADNNEIFIKLMNNLETEFDYKKDHMMFSGNPNYKEFKSPKNMHHEVYLYPETNGATMVQHEIRIIINDILEKMNEEYLVFDSDLKALRKVNYSDFAILIDRGSAFDSVVTNFKKCGIPIKIVGDTKVNDNAVVLSLVSLLKVYINDPSITDFNDFKHAYVSLLRSFIIGYKDEQIYNIVKANDLYNDDVYKRVMKLKSSASNYPLTKQLEMLIDEFDIANKIVTMGNINENNAALNYVYGLIKSMEDLSYSFEDVVDYFVGLNKNNIAIKNELLDESDDSVTLMTIHKSKGLQFKIVYLPELFKETVRDRTSNVLVFNPKYGMELGYFDKIEETGPISNPGNILYNYIKSRESREDLLERVRLLYVALTRAEEKVIMLAPKQEKPRIIESLSSCRSFHDFLFYSGVLNTFLTREIDPRLLSTSVPRPASKSDNPLTIEIKDKFNMSKEMIVSSRASRADITEIDPDALAIGNQFHAYLELIDFNNPDISFIKDKNHQQILNIFLKNPLISGLKKTKILHEFAFYDTLNQREGIIDLISISDDTVKVIDYKTSHIDNPAYDNQIKTYVSYLKTLPALSNKKFEGYLISILKNKYREVDLSDVK